MVRSYVEFLKEEGAQAVLSSFPNISPQKVEGASLSLLSFCYFSSDDTAQIGKLENLIQIDQKRKAGVVGNDIFRCLDSELYQNHEETYRQAVDLISSVWPEYHAMIQAIEPRLAKTTDDDPFESASDPTTFGQILFRMDTKCPVKWAEILVHELGHHYLNIIITTHEEQDVFNQPWDETKYSAIRDTDRPLIGIYHGAFAQACMLGLACRILSDSKTSSAQREGALRIIDRFYLSFQKDYQTIQEHGLLSFDDHITEIIQTIKVDLANAAEFKECASTAGVV